jgi:hypothetical protein
VTVAVAIVAAVVVAAAAAAVAAAGVVVVVVVQYDCNQYDRNAGSTVSPQPKNEKDNNIIIREMRRRFFQSCYRPWHQHHRRLEELVM